MNDREQEQPERDWNDRLVDSALHELHGQRPPDLSSRVLLALQAPPVGALPVVQPSAQPIIGARARRLPLVLTTMLAMAALCLVAWSLDLFGSGRESAIGRHEVARLDVQVLLGEVECVELATPAAVRCAAGQQVSFDAQPGNRLRCVADSMTRVGPFGVFAAAPRTELEVRSMEFTRQKGMVVASTLTLAVVAGTVTWHMLTRTETASAGETLRLEANPAASKAASDQALEIARLQQQVKELQQKNTELETQAARTRVPEPAPEAVTEKPEAAPVEVSSLAFSDPKYADALSKIDWKNIGGVTKEMAPLLAELIAKTAKDGEMPMDLAIKLSQLNMKLVEQVPQMMKSGLPGFGPNGTYTHPLIVANSLASTLAAAGMPLNDGQRSAIEGMVRAFSAENQSITDSTHDFDLEGLLAETEMKDRMYNQFKTLLGPDQSGVITPEGSNAYEGGNLFDSGIMARVYGEPVQAKDATDFARKVSSKISDQLDLDEATAAKVQSIIAQHAGAASELWSQPAGAVETSQLHMLRAGRTTAALRRQLEVMRAIERQVNLTPAQRKKLASMKQVFVPLPN